MHSPTPAPARTCNPALQYDGETAVRSEVPGATIFRPAVMTGVEDRFFNAYAQLVKKLPFIPLVDGGETRLQPVWVRDVAQGEAAAGVHAGAGWGGAEVPFRALSAGLACHAGPGQQGASSHTSRPLSSPRR